MAWLGWLLVVGLVVFAGFRLYFARLRDRARESAPQLWNHLFQEGALDEFPDKATILESFLIRDSINPLSFIANYANLSPFAALSEIPGQPTRSIAAFAQGLNAPLGYPRWFLAAYPDVVLWLANGDERSMAQTIAALYGVDEASRLIQTHGAEKAMEMIEQTLHDDDKNIKSVYLRRVVDLYRMRTSRGLECAL